MPKFKITRTIECDYETIVDAIDADTAHEIALELDITDYRQIAEDEEHSEAVPFDPPEAPALQQYRVVIAQSVLTEIIVTASDREQAEQLAWDSYEEIECIFPDGRWISDANEIVAVDAYLP